MRELKRFLENVDPKLLELRLWLAGHETRERPVNKPVKPDGPNYAQLLADELNANIFLYNGPIDEDGFGKVVEAAVDAKKDLTAFLILVTNGGSANSAYRIARFYQRNFPKLTILTPSYCKSAGTLLCFGAHNLVMSEFSEFGPIDVQVFKIDEVFETRSGLLHRSALESLAEVAFTLYEQFLIQIKMRSGGLISFPTASNVAASIVTGVLSPIYSQIDPTVLGEDHRNLSIGVEYGKRLIQYSGNTEEVIVKYFLTGFPSHDFVIDAEEVARYFKNVEMASSVMYSLLGDLKEAAFKPMSENNDIRLLATPTDEPVEEAEQVVEEAHEDKASDKAKSKSRDAQEA